LLAKSWQDWGRPGKRLGKDEERGKQQGAGPPPATQSISSLISHAHPSDYRFQSAVVAGKTASTFACPAVWP